MTATTAKEIRDIIREIGALAGCIRAEMPLLSRSEILQIVSTAETADRAAREIADAHAVRLIRNMRERYVIGPSVH